jgi:hypothetical protein
MEGWREQGYDLRQKALSLKERLGAVTALADGDSR